MRKSDCVFEKVSNIGVGIALLFVALGLVVIGVTLTPVLGLFIAVPVFLIAAYFFTAPTSPECQLK